LHPCPEAIYAAVCSFPNVEAAVNTAIKTIQKGVPIAKIELLDATLMHAINQYTDLRYQEKPTLFLEFHGAEAELEAQIRKVQQYARELGSAGFIWEKEAASRAKLWQARMNAPLAVAALVPGSQLMSTDVCVPISQLAKCIVETQSDIEATGLLAPILGHVGDGNFHLAIPLTPDDPITFAKAKALNERLVHRALALEGTCSGEHGIGMGKLSFMQSEHREALDTMRAIKKALDPTNLMNPGKLLPMDD
jgi:D-lactate dehydrogenase (cytochrome)